MTAGCGSTGTGLVTVAGDGNLPAISQIRLTLSAGNGSKTVTFPDAEGGPLALPKTVSVTFPKGDAGPLTADVDGLSGGMVVAHGTGTAPLADGTVMVGVTLSKTSQMGDGGMVADMSMPDLVGADLTVVYLGLGGPWNATMDSGNMTQPTVNLVTSEVNKVTVSSQGGTACGGCNARTARIPLMATYPCASSTLEFDYSTTAAPNTFSSTNSSSLFIGFFAGQNQVGFYSASEQAVKSACAVAFSGSSFPSTPQLKEGTNDIAIGGLTSSLNGHCGGSFDTLEVHLQGYGCGPNDTSTSTLTNLRVY